ncbi:MAG: extracellular solute-binding protein, partial [Chloroflexi bacterium]|nr:extracellular solute-binding protein [Chloroflexota bacterium]
MTKLSRRELLRMGATITGGMLAACRPSVVKETVVVEKEVEKVVKETVIVETEKVVKEIVEKDVAAERAAALTGKLVWDTFRQPGTGWNEERITTFKDIYPNVEVEFRPAIVAAQQDAYGKWYAMYAAGDLGDITQFDPSHYHFWRAIDKGMVLPITEFINEEGLDLKQWFDAFMEMQFYKGDYYGLPSWGWTGYDCLVTNFLHFKEAGLEPPNPTGHDYSMDQIAQWARDFYKAGKGPGEVERYGISLNYGDAGVTVLTRAFGGDLINAEGTKCLLLEEKSAQAMRWAYQLAVEEKITPAPGELSSGDQGAWAAGKLTMYHCGSLCVINANKAITDETLAEIGQVLFPIREDGKVPSQLRGGTWDITSTTKYPRAAYEF